MKKVFCWIFFIFGIALCAAILALMIDASVLEKAKYEEKNKITEEYVETPFPENFTTKLIRSLPSDKNNVASQLGAFTVATLIANGVSGDAQQEIVSALDVSDVNNANEIVKNQMRNKSSEVEIYNSAWGDFLSTYKQSVADLDTDLMDISKISELNEWISQRTHGLISGIGINPHPLLRFVLVNVVYFKDRWRSPFDEKMTRGDIFYSLNGEKDFVQMMKSDSMNVPYYENSELKSVKLPYKNGDEMIILMPKGDFNEFLRNFKPEYLSLPYSNLKLTVYLPRFTIETDINLEKIFKNMGINRIFELRNSTTEDFDFNKMLVNNGMPDSKFVDKMQQRSKIIVEESGTVAVAVTYSDGFADTLEMPPEEIRIDHPFIFLIDKSLFVGTYVKGKAEGKVGIF